MQPYPIQPQAAPGKTFLLVVGILYIIFGTSAIFISIFGLATSAYWDQALPTPSGLSWSIYYTILLLGSFFNIFIGIMGVVFRKTPAKAGVLKIIGCLDIVHIVVVTAISSIAFNTITLDTAEGMVAVIITVVSFLISLVLPTLYIIGAKKNLSAD